MGTWGERAFDNDDAADWADDFVEGDDLSPVEVALDAVAVNDRYVEAPTAWNALAACEVLARLLDRAGYRDDTTEAVDEWVADHAQCPPADLLSRAVAAIDRILADDSKLKELWAESEEYDQWVAAVTDLRSRVCA